MAINNIGYGASILGRATQTINDRLATLSGQLASGKKATTYAGMGVNEGFAVAARAQLSNISAFTDTMVKINTTIGATNTALQAMVDIGRQLQNAAANSSQALGSTGQTAGQQNAVAQLASMLGILNTQSGDRYIFSGAAIDRPAVAGADLILNGTSAQAGLKQVIAERKQADLGTGGLGRMVISQTTSTSVSVAEDFAGSPFGLKLNAVSSSLTGATVTGPAGSPSAVSIGFAGNPNVGDQITFTFNLPDGTTESVRLTASNATPAPTGSFAIGTTPTATSTNLNAALTVSVGTLAKTSLVAASAVAAGNDFFGQPPKRVGTTPLGTATTLVSGSAANTVSWYTGQTGAGSARASTTARIDQSVIVQYGARADETAIRTQLQAIAVYAAVTTPVSDPNAGGQIAALSSRVPQSLTPPPGQQTIPDMQSDFSVAQNTMKDATARQKQTQSTLQALVDQAENISPEQVASQILALQTSLQASYQTTAMLAQLNLPKFL